MTSIAAESYVLPLFTGRSLVVAPDLRFGKKISPRGRSRLFGSTKRHSRRDEQLSHYEMSAGKPAGGGRQAVLERVIAHDAEELDEPEIDADPWSKAIAADTAADLADFDFDRRREERRLCSEEYRLQAAQIACKRRRLLKQIRRNRRRVAKLEAAGEFQRETRLRLVLIDLELSAA